jgi:outer membrane protein OmpA-like peptidoglycan-associated protein
MQMMSKAHKNGATNTAARKAGGVVAAPKNREGAGNHQRANALPNYRGLQAKLSIGKANDPFEQEADRVASEVMRMGSESEVATMNQTGGAHLVQRKCDCGGGCDKCKKKQLSLKRVPASAHESGEVPSSVDAVLRSLGEPLDAGTRAFMEPRFGYDFGQVRVHNNSAAAQSARDVNALAFTVGNHIAFASGQYSPGSAQSNHLLAHELAHVVQQGGAGPSTSGPQVSGVIQRAGASSAIPTPFACDTDLTAGRPVGTELPFPTGGTKIDSTHDPQLSTFLASWIAAGATDDIVVHGFASTTGASKAGGETMNWNLSCDRAQHTRDALIARGIPSVNISVVAHGTSTDFGAAPENNQVAVITSSPGGFFTTPLVFGTLTPADNFTSRSNSRFGVGEVIDLRFLSIPPRPAADFGGLSWVLVSGGGTLTAVTLAGTATYTAPATADTVQLDLTVAGGATAGRVLDTRTISIVEPSAVRMVEVAGSSPSFTPGGTIAVNVWGAGFQADVFVDPKDVSFQGVVFGEGSVAAVVTPPGSFLFAAGNGQVHPTNTFGPGHAGNATTGTPVSPPQDQISGSGLVATGKFAGFPTCGTGSDFLWAIPWEFQVGTGARTPFAGGFTANHHMTSTFFCAATIEKGGAGPFCRRIDGTTC